MLAGVVDPGVGESRTVFEIISEAQHDQSGLTSTTAPRYLSGGGMDISRGDSTEVDENGRITDVAICL
jgi:hypothetical protein